MWIELGIVNYKIIIPLIYPFLYQIRRILHNDDKKPIFSFFTNFCGYLFSGFIYLIIRSRTKKINSKDIENVNSVVRKESSKELTDTYSNNEISKVSTVYQIENQLDKEKKKHNTERKKSQYLSILLLVCIYLIPMFLDSYTAINNELNFGTSSSISLFFFIIFYIGLSRILLGDKIYWHQIFSSIIIICSIIIVIILYLIKDNLTKNIFLNLLLIIIVTFFFSLFNTLEKKYFIKYMASPYHFMFIMGLYALSFILIYEIFTVIIFGFDTVFNGVFFQAKENIQKYEGLYILIFIADVISAFVWLAGIQLTVYFFSPCHFIISESISQIISTFLNNTIEGFPIHEKIIIIFLFIIILLATLIYNEIVIINIWSLNKNTKKNIILRELKEKREIMDSKNKNFIEEENDTKVIYDDKIV